MCEEILSVKIQIMLVSSFYIQYQGVDFDNLQFHRFDFIANRLLINCRAHTAFRAHFS